MPTLVISKKRKHSPGKDGGSGVLKKRKHSHHKVSTTEEVESVDGVQNQEHARILGSVTGKISKLPSEGEEELDTERDSSERDKDKCTEDKGAEESQASKLAASEYLLLWSQNRKKWAFRKKTQYWLLQNMYEKKMVGLRLSQDYMCYKIVVFRCCDMIDLFFLGLQSRL